MKYLLYVVILIFLPLNFLFADTIESFDVDIKLNQNNTAIIKETIEYNFGSTPKHGIYRKIPKNFRPKGNIVPIDIKVLSITDANGFPYSFKNEGIVNLDLKIGDPDLYVTGTKTYIIEYRVSNLIGFFENNDELYWNLTGNEWKVDYIKNTTATVHFPSNEIDSINNYSYCGYSGSTDTCGEFFVSGDSVNFNSDRILNTGEGITVDLEFNKGIIRKSSLAENILAIIFEHYYVLVSLFIAIFLFRFFFKKRLKASKNYKNFIKNHPDMVQYDPGDFSLIEASFFHDGDTSLDRDLSAFIVWAAVERYIKIIEKDGDYFFNKLDKTEKIPEGSEKDLINKIAETKIVKKFGKNIIADKDRPTNSWFAKSSVSFVEDLNELANDLFNFYAFKIMDAGYLVPEAVEEIKKISMIHIDSSGKAIQKKIEKNVSFSDASRNKFIRFKRLGKINYFDLLRFSKYTLVIILVLLSMYPGVFISSFLSSFGGLRFIPQATILFLVVLIIIFLKNIPSYTQKGLEASWYINGLYKYIDMSEKERINFANAPEKTPALFEKLLPYAMVFGLEDKWTKEFMDIYFNNDPDWVESTNHHFSVVGLGSAVSNSLSSISNSKSGGGGFSGGGGSSGGGGGGGGGGSW